MCSIKFGIEAYISMRHLYKIQIGQISTLLSREFFISTEKNYFKLYLSIEMTRKI